MWNHLVDMSNEDQSGNTQATLCSHVSQVTRLDWGLGHCHLVLKSHSGWPWPTSSIIDPPLCLVTSFLLRTVKGFSYEPIFLSRQSLALNLILFHSVLRGGGGGKYTENNEPQVRMASRGIPEISLEKNSDSRRSYRIQIT